MTLRMRQVDFPANSLAGYVSYFLERQLRGQ